MNLFKKNKLILPPRFLFFQSSYDLFLATRIGRRFNGLVSHPLIVGSSIIFFGSILGNLFNFLLNLFISRNLSIVDYGVVASLLSLMTLFILPVGAVIPTIIYFSASSFAKGNLDEVRELYRRITGVSFLIGVIIFTAFFLFRNIIGKFFHIQETGLILLIGVIVLVSFISIANQPLLQAKLSFRFLSYTNVLTSFTKLVLGVFLVFLGYSIGGVLWAFLISSLVFYFLSFFQLKFLFYKGSLIIPLISLKTIFSYGSPAALTTLGLTSFITFDIVLVKHFFSSTDAGIYAILSIIGKVIYYFSAPIASVMFPLIAQKHVKGEKYHNDLKLALLLVSIPSLCIIVFYALFPGFVITFFSQKILPESATQLIIPFSIFMTLYALLTVLCNFYLSINKVKIFIPILIGSFSQIILILIFHESFLQIITISIGITGLLLIGFLLYYLMSYDKRI